MDLFRRWLSLFLKRRKFLLFMMTLTAEVSAFRAVNAATVDKESQLFEPVLLFLREEDEPASAISTTAKHIEVFCSRNDRIILLRFISRDSGCWKDPGWLILIDPKLRGPRQLLAAECWCFSITRMSNQFIDIREQLSGGFDVELVFPARCRILVWEYVGHLKVRCFT